MAKYPEHKELNLPKIASDMLKHWKENEIFEQSVSIREGKPRSPFMKGLLRPTEPAFTTLMAFPHHQRHFCRYKTLRGFPGEAQRRLGYARFACWTLVEKCWASPKMTTSEQNLHCRLQQEVPRNGDDVAKHQWDDLTRRRWATGLTLKDPYITYDSKYIESIWRLLKQLYEKEVVVQRLHHSTIFASSRNRFEFMNWIYPDVTRM